MLLVGPIFIIINLLRFMLILFFANSKWAPNPLAILALPAILLNVGIIFFFIRVVISTLYILVYRLLVGIAFSGKVNLTVRELLIYILTVFYPYRVVYRYRTVYRPQLKCRGVLVFSTLHFYSGSRRHYSTGHNSRGRAGQCILFCSPGFNLPRDVNGDLDLLVWDHKLFWVKRIRQLHLELGVKPLQLRAICRLGNLTRSGVGLQSHCYLQLEMLFRILFGANLPLAENQIVKFYRVDLHRDLSTTELISFVKERGFSRKNNLVLILIAEWLLGRAPRNLGFRYIVCLMCDVGNNIMNVSNWRNIRSELSYIESRDSKALNSSVDYRRIMSFKSLINIHMGLSLEEMKTLINNVKGPSDLEVEIWERDPNLHRLALSYKAKGG